MPNRTVGIAIVCVTLGTAPIGCSPGMQQPTPVPSQVTVASAELGRADTLLAIQVDSAVVRLLGILSLPHTGMDLKADAQRRGREIDLTVGAYEGRGGQLDIVTAMAYTVTLPRLPKGTYRVHLRHVIQTFVGSMRDRYATDRTFVVP